MSTVEHAEQSESRPCSDWEEIRAWMDRFPPPTVEIDDGEVQTSGWAFRGLQRKDYGFETTIERAVGSKSVSWSQLEVLIGQEFKSRAPLHLPPGSVPRTDLAWLALMRHHHVPSRLLDVTRSPYVALYFAARRDSARNQKSQGRIARLCAINVGAVNKRFRTIVAIAEFNERKRRGERAQLATVNLDQFDQYSEVMAEETEGLRQTAERCLVATGELRAELQEHGCVCALSPREQNPRLASQQGLFLLSCTENTNLKDSLFKMMGDEADWFCHLDIAGEATEEIERRLFKMNIHEQSLFPDLEGLAGLICQQARLYWQ